MKKTLAIILTVASFAACTREDLSLIVEEPEVQTYTMSVEATKGEKQDDDTATRALSLSGSTLNATWTAGDAVEVWTSDGTTTKYGTLNAETSGASTKLKGTLSSLPGNGQSLLLKYLSPAYATQDGTLTGSASSIDRVCDYATATVTATVVGSSVTATDANFVNQQAIVKFTLKNKADASALSVNKLFVTAGGTTCEVTPSGATSELYVAVPAIASGRVTLTALSGSTYYDYLKTGVTLAQSQYYTISASLTEVKSISNAREASLGRVVAADRMMYASVESATNAGTTALAVIARMHAGIVHNDFTAIAVSDESSKMNWNNANNACNNKTPIGGATWQLPSVSLWEDMFWFNGGNQNSYTGLDALITKAGGTALDTEWYYWTSTDVTNNSDTKRKILLDSNGTVYYFETGSDKSSLLLVRAFLTFQGDYSIL